MKRHSKELSKMFKVDNDFRHGGWTYALISVTMADITKGFHTVRHFHSPYTSYTQEELRNRNKNSMI